MKIKFFLLSSILFLSQQAFSQWTDTGAIIYTNDKVGIGTSSLDNAVLLKVQGSTSPAIEIANSSNTRLQIGIPTSPNDFSVGSILGDAVIRPSGGINGHNGLIFSIPNNNNDGNSYFAFGDSYNALWMKIFNNKIVKIDGKLFAKEIEVKTDVWSDFVFKSDYKLMPLNELESFIKENNHLPNIPTEAEVKTNGINVAEMNAKLLQKVEELTLYVIEQQKQIEELKNKH
ncbi:MAG: hypothetical protein Q8P34_11165 [Bacteroidota bacterium]|nr:hypothetical protein [Bacteroidota bacterium]